MGKIRDFLREQLRRSAATNSKSIIEVSSAVTNKDIVGVGKAVVGVIGSSVKEVADEMASAKNELVQEFSSAPQQPDIISANPYRTAEFEGILIDKQGNAALFSEGSESLRTLLLNLWDNGIQTLGCCAGHKDKPHYAVEVDYDTQNKFRPISQETYLENQGNKDYHCFTFDEPGYFSFGLTGDRSKIEAFAVDMDAHMEKFFSDAPFHTSFDPTQGHIGLHLEEYVSDNIRERFFSKATDAISHAMSLHPEMRRRPSLDSVIAKANDKQKSLEASHDSLNIAKSKGLEVAR